MVQRRRRKGKARQCRRYVLEGGVILQTGLSLVRYSGGLGFEVEFLKGLEVRRGGNITH